MTGRAEVVFLGAVLAVLAAGTALAQETEDTPAGGAVPAAADSLGTASVDTLPPPADPSLAELLRPSISPTRAVLITPLFPGWGQLYSKSSWRAGLAYAVQMFYWSHFLMYDHKARRTRDFANRREPGPWTDEYHEQAHEFWERKRDFAWWALGGMLIIALDAYVGAHLFRFEEDPLPVPTSWPGGEEPDPAAPGGELIGPTVMVLRWGFRF